MRYSILIAILSLLIGCNQNAKNPQKIKYSGYFIPSEGGSIDMTLDSITPLKDLIPQLRTKNKLYDTYKSYWIGYNDLMFSIAVYSDNAIEPLINFIDTTSSYEAQNTALYTLHLIGINCKIAGRTHEKFTNIKARNAMIKLLLTHEKLQPEIMLLLIRDPKANDVPRLFRVMNLLSSDCWSISSGLLRYDLRNAPINQPIPEEISDKTIHLDYPLDYSKSETYQKLLKLFSKKYPKFIEVEDTLFNYQYRIRMWFPNSENLAYLGDLTRYCNNVDYCSIGINFQYYIEDNKIHFCSATTSKKRWIEWWQSQNNSYKDSLENNGIKINDRF